MFELVRADIRQAQRFSVGVGLRGVRWWLRAIAHPGVHAVLIYRYGSWAHRLRVPVVRQIFLVLYWCLRVCQIVVCQVSISAEAEIGPGFVVHNWGGVFIPPIKAGRNLYVHTGVVISYSVERIGDDVYLAAGAKLCGPIRVGNNVMVGANAVVSFNVPDNTVVLPPTCRVVPRAFFEDRKRKRKESEASEVAKEA